MWPFRQQPGALSHAHTGKRSGPGIRCGFSLSQCGCCRWWVLSLESVCFPALPGSPIPLQGGLVCAPRGSGTPRSMHWEEALSSVVSSTRRRLSHISLLFPL